MKAVLATGRRCHGAKAGPEAPSSHLDWRQAPSRAAEGSAPRRRLDGRRFQFTAQFTECVGRLRMYLEEAGRDPSTFAISKRVYVAIDDDARRAETRLREWFGHRYKNADMASEVSVWGSVSQCIDGIANVVEAGAEMVMLNQVFDHTEHLEALAQEVIPQF